MIQKNSILPHEIFFGVFLMITWSRLVHSAGFFHFHSLVFFLFFAMSALFIFLCIKNETEKRWKIRILYYPIATGLSYLFLRGAMPIINSGKIDLILQKIDQVLVRGNLSLKCQSFIHPLLTEFMSLCYLLFFLYVVLGLIFYFKNEELTKKFYVGLFSIYGIGFLSYTIFPALGPYLAMAEQFNIPLTEGYFFTNLNNFLIPIGTNYCDVFPSLHCSVSAYILFFDRIYAKKRYRCYFLFCLSIWVSTIYLRYHYFVDVIAGFILTAVAFWIIRNFNPTYEKTKSF